MKTNFYSIERFWNSGLVLGIHFRWSSALMNWNRFGQIEKNHWNNIFPYLNSFLRAAISISSLVLEPSNIWTWIKQNRDFFVYFEICCNITTEIQMVRQLWQHFRQASSANFPRIICGKFAEKTNSPSVLGSASEPHYCDIF